jgi:hypothetical protein
MDRSGARPRDDAGRPAFLCFDADNHYHEALDAFTRHIDPGFEKRCRQWAEIGGRKRLLVGARVDRFLPNPTRGTAAAFPAAPPSSATAGEEVESGGGEIELLSVESAKSGSFDGERLALEGVGPTLFLTDRPARLDGHQLTADFVSGWDEGPDSSEQNPPNAALSILGEKKPREIGGELAEPRIDGDTASYRVVLKDSEIPAKLRQASLFIDGKAGAWIGGALIGSAPTRANMNSEIARKQSAGYS